jgi:hypothetical protein
LFITIAGVLSGAEGWNDISDYGEAKRVARMRKTIHEQMEHRHRYNRLTAVNLLKRHALKRCIYGVDVNAMTVELAKVFLGLNCFILGAPLSLLITTRAGATRSLAARLP